jgi:hypothetical protein
MDRDLRPIALASATAVVSGGLMAAAIVQGWLGPDVNRGAGFCEAGRDWVVRQPANTFSNLGFVTAGLLIAWHAGRRGSIGTSLATHRWLASVMACLVVLLGPGSAAMHATQSSLGGDLDVLSMYLVASFALAYASIRWLHGDIALFAGIFFGGIVFCEVLGSAGLRFPVVNTGGNAAFALLLLLATAVEVLIVRRGELHANRTYAYVSLASILTAFAIWNASKRWLCDPQSLVQGHAIWHLLGAVSAYFLYRYYASEEIDGPIPLQTRNQAQGVAS